jgi:hypothetical protein
MAQEHPVHPKNLRKFKARLREHLAWRKTQCE